ncbi:family 16 glycosylhydrolase [Algoriphagus namhaensis]|uniref:Family 16 glycosylhydrolase n=1 Tax=Algoriphagus namhaensis TaxID=915353 RepID=A0ABV8AMM6_9BACT
MKRINLMILAAGLIVYSACSSDGDDTPNPGSPVEKVVIPTSGATSPNSYPGMSLVWEDDFQGSSLNTSNWSYEIGRGNNGWGNNELQYYRRENTSLQDGHLIITAKKENFEGAAYTSSRLVTMNKQDFRYGRIDIRATMPRGQGLWPALWMLGSNFSEVGWPNCGEIDIMEMIGGNGRENTVHGTVHWDNNGSRAQFGGEKRISTGTLADQFHVYSIVWDATSIKWLINDEQYHEIDTTPAGLDEFRRKFFFIFNVAVGGDWPGSPNTTTTFPQHMIVDYVRVFQTNP